MFSKVLLEKMCGKFIDTESPCDPCTETCVPITEYFVPLEILKTQKSLENNGKTNVFKTFSIMETTGFEPATFALRTQRSPN